MKVRILWVSPSETERKIGAVYDLADTEAKGMIALGEAEAVDKSVKADADPRSAKADEAAA